MSCAKRVELIYYKLGQSLIQTGEIITKCANFFTQWGKHNYKAGHLRITTMGQEILKSGAVNPLQNDAIIIIQNGMYYRKGRLTTKWNRYYKLGKSFHEVQQVIHYKVGQSLLESVVGVIMYNNFIAKWTNVTKKTRTSS